MKPHKNKLEDWVRIPIGTKVKRRGCLGDYIISGYAPCVACPKWKCASNGIAVRLVPIETPYAGFDNEEDYHFYPLANYRDRGQPECPARRMRNGKIQSYFVEV